MSTVEVRLQCWQWGQYQGLRLQVVFSARTFVKEMFEMRPTRHGGGRRCHARAPLPKLIGKALPMSVTSRYSMLEMLPPSFVEMPMPDLPDCVQVTLW